MSEVRELKINAEQALWDHLSDMRDVLLGAEGGGSHLQPMAPQEWIRSIRSCGFIPAEQLTWPQLPGTRRK